MLSAQNARIQIHCKEFLGRGPRLKTAGWKYACSKTLRPIDYLLANLLRNRWTEVWTRVYNSVGMNLLVVFGSEASLTSRHAPTASNLFCRSWKAHTAVHRVRADWLLTLSLSHAYIDTILYYNTHLHIYISHNLLKI